jgi:hypothetical protein
MVARRLSRLLIYYTVIYTELTIPYAKRGYYRGFCVTSLKKNIAALDTRQLLIISHAWLVHQLNEFCVGIEQQCKSIDSTNSLILSLSSRSLIALNRLIGSFQYERL